MLVSDTPSTLIEMKPPKASSEPNKENIESNTSPNPTDMATNIQLKQVKEDGLTTPENKTYPVPEHVEPEPKRGAS